MFEVSIHEEAKAVLHRLNTKHKDLKKEIGKTYAFIVFPSVGRASLVIGGAYGHGEVYEQGAAVGFATLSQFTIGVQVGGQTFTVIVMFNKKDDFNEFKHRGKIGFSANASAVFLNAAASGTTNFNNVIAHAFSTGGMLIEASLGFSKMMFIPPLEKLDKKRDIQQEIEAEQNTGTGAKQKTEPGLKDILSGSIGPELLGKLASMPIVGRIISSLRFLSPILPKKYGIPSILKVANELSTVRIEKKYGNILHDAVRASLVTIRERNPDIEKKFKESYGYAVFPVVSGVSLVLGGAKGIGEVFEKQKLIGYTKLIQITIGVQIGGETFSEVVFFPDKAALDKFKEKKPSFAGNAAAVIVKAGAETTTKYHGLQISIFSEGGLLIKASIGWQNFYFTPAIINKGRSDEQQYNGSQTKGAQEKAQQEKVTDRKDGKPKHGSWKVGRFKVEEVR